MKHLIFALALSLVGCAHKPKPCGLPCVETAVLTDVMPVDSTWNLKHLEADPELIEVTPSAMPIGFIQFEKGSAELSPYVAEFLRVLAGISEVSLVANGYASSERSPSKAWTDKEEADYNLMLSLRRAEAACAPFLARGKNCMAAGHGETQRFGEDYQNNRVVKFTRAE